MRRNSPCRFSKAAKVFRPSRKSSSLTAPTPAKAPTFHQDPRRSPRRGGAKNHGPRRAPVAPAPVSIRSPLWSGGGVVFGPKPRDFSKKINGKVKALAFSRALFDRAVAGEIDVIEAFSPATPKTKLMHQVVRRICPKGKVLLVDAPFTAETNRAARNLDRVTLQEAAKLNTLDLVAYTKIVVSTKALEQIIARATGGQS